MKTAKPGADDEVEVLGRRYRFKVAEGDRAALQQAAARVGSGLEKGTAPREATDLRSHGTRVENALRFSTLRQPNPRAAPPPLPPGEGWGEGSAPHGATDLRRTP